MRTREESATTGATARGLEMAEFPLHHAIPLQEELMARLESADNAIRKLEQRVAMQERTYAVAMQEKNRKIRDLQLSLQTAR